MTKPDDSDAPGVLYPGGGQLSQDERPLLFEQYKLLVETSERLVARRQTVNTFFLSANALLLSGTGIITSEFIAGGISAFGAAAVALAGILLCVAWRRLVHSYRQLNTAKFSVINAIEQKLPAAIFAAEWESLGEGRDSKKYTPFTRTEGTIPIMFMVLYVVFVGLGVWNYFGS